MATPFEEALLAAEQAATSAPATNAPPTTNAPISDFERQLREAEAALGAPQRPDPLVMPNAQDIAQSVSRAQRMDALAKEIDASVLRMQDVRQVSPNREVGRMAESVLAPVLNVGSALGTMARRAAISRDELAADPNVQAQLGARPGVPFDATGDDPRAATFMDRLTTQFTFNRAETAYALMANNPNVQDVRFNSLGDPIMVVRDPDTGKTRDILANPLGLDAGDIAFAVANVPNMVGGWYAALGRDPKSVQGASRVMRWLLSSRSVPAASARMAIGGQAAQTATEIGTRGSMELAGELPDADSIDPMRSIARHAKGAVVDFLFGNVIGGVGAVGTRAVSPFSARGPLQMDAEAAQALWRREGINYEFTPGQRTGSPFLLRSEAFEGQKPGAGGVFDRFTEAQREAQRGIQRIMLGRDPSAVPAADVVGQRALDAIGQRLTPLDTIVDRGTQDILRIADEELKVNLANATRIPQPVVQSAVGQRLFQGAETRLAASEAQRETLYDVVRSDPRVLGQGRNIDVSDLAADAQAAVSRLPAFEQTVQRPVMGAGGQPMLDASGQPITQSVTQVTQLNALTDPKAIGGLRQLAEAQGGRMGYADLIQARNEAGNAMSNARLLGGIPDARLSNLYAMLTRKIETGLDSLDASGGLRQAWERANTFTRDEMQRFEQLDILPMFGDQTRRGTPNLYEIVNKAFNDPGRYMAYRDFFGTASDEMSQLRRAYVDKLTGSVVGSDVIDGAGFASRITSEFNDPARREVLQDVFGQRLTQAKGLADVSAAAAKGNMNAGELANLLATGTPTRSALENLQAVQALREQTYRNNLLDDLRKGGFAFEPSRFVDNVVFSPKAQPSEVREALSLISDPTVRDEVAQRVLMRIFNESMAGATASKQALKGSLIDHFLENHSGNMLGDRVLAAIGQQRFDQLRSASALFKPSEEAQRTFRAAGSISAGTQVSNFEQAVMDPRSALGAAGDVVRSWLLSLGYMFGPTRAWIGNNMLGPGGSIADRAALLNNLVGAAPTIENFSQIMGSEGDAYARALAVHLKNALDQDVRSGSTNAPATR